VCALAQARARAFATASPGLLAGVDEPGGTAMAADLGLVRKLQERGLHLREIVFTVTEVRVLARTADTATVTASVATGAHRQVRVDGSVAAQIPAAPARRVRLVLVGRSAGSSWRVRSADPVLH
jgi:hypothetical protein